MKIKNNRLLVLLTLFVLAVNCLAIEIIPPTHPAIHYVGRVDRSNPTEVRFDWPGVSIGCIFTGNQIGINIEGGEKNYFNLFIDGELLSVFSAPRDTTLFFRLTNDVVHHELLLTKRTEADMGMARFTGFILDEKAEILPSSRKSTRRIEFIGNSITCGYGTEGANRDERFSPNTENNHFIAHSGKGVVRNYGDEKMVSDPKETMPGRYDRTLDNDTTHLWDFKQWKAHCVVINLGTNDYSTQPHPDRVAFLNAYKELIAKVRSSHGNVPIFCVVGPMINEPCFSYLKELTYFYRTEVKDTNIYFAGLPDKLLNDGVDLGSDWHPSYKGQLKIAAQLLAPIATVMDWDFQTEEIYP
jgi:lysophospholipase L1-like esterase